MRQSESERRVAEGARERGRRPLRTQIFALPRTAGREGRQLPVTQRQFVEVVPSGTTFVFLEHRVKRAHDYYFLIFFFRFSSQRRANLLF